MVLKERKKEAVIYYITPPGNPVKFFSYYLALTEKTISIIINFFCKELMVSIFH